MNDEASTGGFLRILLIDDEPLLLKSYARYLEREGDREVVSALGGADGLALLAAGEPFDLVFCDLSMSGVDGVDVHRAVCAYHPELARRFLFLTGGAIDEATEDYAHCAGVEVLTKPVSRSVFEKAIATAVSR